MTEITAVIDYRIAAETDNGEKPKSGGSGFKYG